MARKYENTENWSAHFSDVLPQEALDYIHDKALTSSRYIFTERIGKKQFGYCTHCKASFESKLRHGQIEQCPICGRECVVKASGVKRSKLVDQELVTWYSKSLIDPNVITARCIWCVRDYRHKYKGMETTTADVGLYIFSQGKVVMFYKPFWFNFSRPYRYSWGLSEAWNPDGALVGVWNCAAKAFEVNKQFVAHSYSRNNVAAAVDGTPFRYSCWEQYEVEDMTRFFALYSVAPCIEYFTKLRMKNLVLERLKGWRTYGAVNWRGKNLLSVLRLTKQEFNAIRESDVSVEFDFLAVFHAIRKTEPTLPNKEAVQLAQKLNGDMEIVKVASRLGIPIRRAASWAEKQLKMKDDNHQFFYMSSVTDTWNTYLNECRQLELDLSKEAVVMPKSLHRAHQRTLVQIKVKDNKALEDKFEEQAKKLAKLKYSSGALCIVPARTMKEIIVEGQTLSHCVGSYAERHAKGETAILFIRRLDEPKKPYYTVEVRNKDIVQVRGLRNCDMTTEVKQFVEDFKQAKLSSKPQKQQETQIAAMA